MYFKIVPKWFNFVLAFFILFSSSPAGFAMANANNTESAARPLPDERRPHTATEKIDAQLQEAFDQNAFVSYLVKFKEQVDVERISTQARQRSSIMKETSAKRKASVRNTVIHTLQDMADRAQAGITSDLEQMEETGQVKDYKHYFIVNAMAVTSTKEVMEQIASRPDVEKVLPNQVYQLNKAPEQADGRALPQPTGSDNVPWNLKNINVPQAWQMGFDGTGIVVANMDSGVDYTHPALQRKWRGFDAQGNIVSPELNWYDATLEMKKLPYDGDGHGTHVMGTMVGSDPEGANKIGVAPQAKWMAARVFDSNGQTTDSAILDAGEWILAPKDKHGNAHPELAPDIVNNSWGNIPAGKNEFFRDIVKSWRAANIMAFFSAGNTKPPDNNGGPGSVTAPANYPESFSTGAVNYQNQLAAFSLRGPSPYGTVKPEVAAPGVSIRSSVPGGGYKSLNGTSMASPHTAGVAALLLQANHSLTADQVEAILKETAVPLTDNDYPQVPSNGYGWGLINALNAVSSLQQGIGTVEGIISIDGKDADLPVIAHTPIPLAFNVMDLTVAAGVKDQTGITGAEVSVRAKGADDWTSVPMKLVSGNAKDGQYEADIPKSLLTVPGVDYKIRATDFGGNTTETTVWSIEISEGVKLGYKQNFEEHIQGFEFGGDTGIWEWGAPTSGPGKAYSGTKVLATKLDGKYPVGTKSFVVMPLIDLRDSQHTILSFTHWYKLGSWMSAIFDKAEIFVASSKTGFAFDRVKHFDFQSYGWKTDYLDLSAYAGEQVFVAFNLNGEYGSDFGWYIDNLELIGPETAPPPAPHVKIRSNTPGRVIVEWDKAPEGKIKEYVIYRSTQPGGNYQEVGTSRSQNYGELPTPQKGTYYYTVKTRTQSNVLSEPSNEVSWTFTAGKELFADDFNGPDDNGWTHSGNNDQWERGVPNLARGPKNAVSGPNVWGTGLSSELAKNSDQSLISPEIDLTRVQHASVYFQQWHDLDEFDKAYVEVSKDNGATWDKIAQYPKQPTRFWYLEEISLGNYVGHKIKVRFHLISKNSIGSAGWYIDDFEVRETPPVKSKSASQANANDDEQPARSGFRPSLQAMRATKSFSLQSSDAAVSSLPADATVTVLETDRSTKTVTGTGRYTLKHPPGDYTLRVEAYGYRPVTRAVSIQKDRTVKADFHLQPLAKGRITGQITDRQTGKPIAGANVRTMEDLRTTPAITDAQGAFSMEAYEGDYTLLISALGYLSENTPIHVQGDQTLVQPVRLQSFTGTPNELAYDSGKADNALAYHVAGNGYAVRMTTDSPSQVTGARFFFWNEGWPAPGGTRFQYAIYEADPIDGIPGKMVAGPYDGTAKTDGTWTDVAFQNPVILNGDFYIAYLQTGVYPDVPGLAVDNNRENFKRSWKKDGDQWSRSTTVGNFMIRAKINKITGVPADPPPGVASIAVTPSQAALKAGDTVRLSVTASVYSSVYSDVYSNGGFKTIPVTSGLNFTSSDGKIASIDQTGLVRGIKAGQATIFITYAGASTSAAITVESETLPQPEPKPEPKPVPEPKPEPDSESDSESTSALPPSSFTTGPKVDDRLKIMDDGRLIGYLKAASNNGMETAVISISKDEMERQLAKGKTEAITMNFTSVSLTKFHSITIELDPATTDRLLASGKRMMITGSSFAIEIPNAALSEFRTKDGLKINMAVSAEGLGGIQPMATGSATLVSPIVSIYHSNDVFGQPITLTLKLDSKTAAGQKAGLYRKDRETGWSFDRASARNGDGLIVTLSRPGSYAALEYHRTFADIAGHWGRNEMEILASQHVIAGKTDDSFVPDDPVTRAEFAVMLDRVLGKEADWHQRAQEEGARQPLTREEAVFMLVEALGIELPSGNVELPFKDIDNLPPKGRSFVAYAFDKGIINGVEETRFAGNELSSRAQAAAMIYRLMLSLGKI
ncbi:S8 family serine peptidase [Paenibacillus elgii]|uniref:S8 family serine peptidase n=1 Tax=Paenibacillus elgii TaxID=189691 RepID=UPI00203CC775|nr:S8 family serine peptidase [Paenibacillus elgii]